VPALLALMAPTFGPVTLRDVLSRAGAGDPACRRVLADAGTAIGEAAAAVCNLINPERIVVGGDLAAAGELLIAPMRDAVLRASIASAAEDGCAWDRPEQQLPDSRPLLVTASP
jgi:predicted NBD/HSP70 family sugar kinase